MATTFYIVKNNTGSSVASSYTPGSGSLTLWNASGFPASYPYRLSTFAPDGTPKSILAITGRTGNVLAVGSALEGTTDVALSVGDLAQLRVTAGAIQDINTAVNTLETTTINGHALTGTVVVTSSDVSLGNVTNDAQLKASQLVTTVGTPGSDANVPSEKAVRTGLTAARGNLWTVGSGVPSNGVGSNGDLYLNNVTGDVYQKVSGSYVIVANIQGAPVAVSSTSTKTTINATTTPGTTLLAANAARKGFMLYNNSTVLTWYVAFGSSGSSSNFSVMIGPGDTYENTLSTDVLTGCASSAAGGTLQVTEFTS